MQGIIYECFGFTFLIWSVKVPCFCFKMCLSLFNVDSAGLEFSDLNVSTSSLPVPDDYEGGFIYHVINVKICVDTDGWNNCDFVTV